MTKKLQDLDLTTNLLSYIKTGGREGERESEGEEKERDTLIIELTR
jgi:hypothetical protein